MMSCKAMNTPIVLGTKLGRDGSGPCVDLYVYRSLVGSLRYVTCTRPDVLFAYGLVSRFMEKPKTDHFAACKRILCYLKASSVSHCLWLRQLLKELEQEQLQPTVVNVDNQSVIVIAKNPLYHDRSKHIDVRFHFLREVVANEVVKLEYVRTQYQVADMLTKSLGYQSFVQLRSMLGLFDSSLRGAYVGEKT